MGVKKGNFPRHINLPTRVGAIRLSFIMQMLSMQG